MEGNSTYQLIVVMPAYNEQDCIEKVACSWIEELKKISPLKFLLVVVNDGSRDQTGAILDQLAQKHPELKVVHQDNAGHGPALVRGMNEALNYRAEWVLHVDSDDQILPSDFHQFWGQRNASPFILGHRAQRHDPLHRLVITKILRMIIAGVFQTSITDANIPYRLIKGKLLRALLDRLPAQVFAPNIFLSVLASKLGFPSLDLVIQHQERKTGEISIVRLGLLKVCFRTFRELLLFRLNMSQHLLAVRQQGLTPQELLSQNKEKETDKVSA